MSRNRLPIIYQAESAECGMACLTMIANYHGCNVSIESIRRRHGASVRGQSARDIVEIARSLGLRARTVRSDLNQLKLLATPCILHWKMDHFVVLNKMASGKAIIHDPALGRQVLVSDAVSEFFTGIAIELYPTPVIDTGVPRRRLRFANLLGRIPGLFSWVTQIGLFAFALQFFLLLMPLFVQLSVDYSVSTSDSQLASTLAAAFLSFLLLQIITMVMRSLTVIKFSARLNFELISKLFSHLVTLPLSYFERRHLGDIASRFRSADAIEETLTKNSLDAIVEATTALLAFVMLLYYDWQIATTVGSAIVLYVVYRSILMMPQRRASKEEIVRIASEDSCFMETVRGIQGIKLFNAEAARLDKYQNLAIDRLNATLNVEKYRILASIGTHAIVGLTTLLVVWLASKKVIDGQFTIGMLYACLTYGLLFNTNTVGVVDKIVSVLLLRLHLNRLSDILMSHAEDTTPAGPRHKSAADGALAITNLSFKYEASAPSIFSSLTLDVADGYSLAIVGKSGIGKSTLMKLMVGLLDPTSGQIQCGGIDIRELGIQRYREMIGVVMQNDVLFRGSIEENISFFSNTMNKRKVQRSARLACIHNDISAMTMSYKSRVGDMGSTLSGGQVQRILIARALYRSPKLLFLDEPSSHLDTNIENEIFSNIAALGMTRFIVTHRPDLIRKCDYVFDMTDSMLYSRDEYHICADDQSSASIGG